MLKTQSRFLFSLLFLLTAALLLLGCFEGDSTEQYEEKAEGSEAILPLEKFVIKTQKGDRFEFNLEVARTKEQQADGLMHRTFMPDNEGMAFPSPEPRIYAMWMKDTQIPLDMVFVDENGEIRHIHWDAQPFSEEVITSQFMTKAVLELRGGIALDKDINPGDFVFHPMFNNMDQLDDEALPETNLEGKIRAEQDFFDKMNEKYEQFLESQKQAEEPKLEDDGAENSSAENAADTMVREEEKE